MKKVFCSCATLATGFAWGLQYLRLLYKQDGDYNTLVELSGFKDDTSVLCSEEQADFRVSMQAFLIQFSAPAIVVGCWIPIHRQEIIFIYLV